MSSKANVIKKFRRWLNSRVELKSGSAGRSNLSLQVGKLLQTRGSELITMTTL